MEKSLKDRRLAAVLDRALGALSKQLSDLTLKVVGRELRIDQIGSEGAVSGLVILKELTEPAMAFASRLAAVATFAACGYRDCECDACDRKDTCPLDMMFVDRSVWPSMAEAHAALPKLTPKNQELLDSLVASSGLN
jgi:endonuclease YncB( thermonuclease family)